MACFRKESPSISSRSKLNPSLALDRVNACRIRPGLGPRLLGDSPVWGLHWGATARSRKEAAAALGPWVALLQAEVALFMWSEVLPGVHSSKGCGGLEMGFFMLWEGCTGTEVVLCIESGICSSMLGRTPWQLLCWWRCSSRWLMSQLTRAVPLIRFFMQAASPGSRMTRWPCSCKKG